MGTTRRALVLSAALAAGTPNLARPQSGPRELAVESAASSIYVVTARRGLLSFLGHEHAILATAWSANICWDDTTPERSSADLRLSARDLVVDTDEIRATAGLGRGPSATQRSEIQRKLLDRLEAETHPDLHFRTTAVRRNPLTLQGDLTIRGITQPVTFPVVRSETESGRVQMTGTVTVRQTAFGIQPESVAAVVNVADPVEIRFVITAVPTGRPCGTPSGS